MSLTTSPKRPVLVLVRPFQRLFEAEASGGLVLVFFALVALVWANSPWADVYHNLFTPLITIGAGDAVLSKPLILWINDGLMAIFFFLVGLEIKREFLLGELASPRQAALPIVAAIGGMIVPALIYFAMNRGTAAAAGWGVPMATDIAFTLGVMALLGKRVPVALKVFVTAVAIVDDLGAVLVIALFYTGEILWMSLGVGMLFLALLALANIIGVRWTPVYAFLGACMWVAFLKSGVHATIAGVLIAATIPVRTLINEEQFTDRARSLIDDFCGSSVESKDMLMSRQQQEAIEELERACEHVSSPLQRLEHAISPYVTYGIMPVFALANAGVVIEGSLWDALQTQVALGTAAGLVVGKLIGIYGASWLAVKSRLAVLPAATRWPQMFGAGWLAGIGFTMSLFIAHLAFGESESLALAKVGILAGSTIAGIIGYFVLRSVAAPGD